jgi:hypothetical protein
MVRRTNLRLPAPGRNAQSRRFDPRLPKHLRAPSLFVKSGPPLTTAFRRKLRLDTVCEGEQAIYVIDESEYRSEAARLAVRCNTKYSSSAHMITYPLSRIFWQAGVIAVYQQSENNPAASGRDYMRLSVVNL